MTDLFRLSGCYETSPQTGAQASGDPQVNAAIDIRLTIDNKTVNTVYLDDDAVREVDLGGIEDIHALIMQTIGGKVTARLTSADGALQSVAVDPFLAVISRTVPFTAVDLKRVTGVPTTVKIFMAQKPV